MSKRKWTSPIDDGTYANWAAMLRRCSGRDVQSSYYVDVEVCKQWADFDQFYRDMGPRPAGMTLDRIHGTAGYTATNCRWASRQTQVRNRSNTIKLSSGGMTLTLQEWAERLGVPYYLLWNRVKAGRATDEILTAKRQRASVAQHGTTTKYAGGCRCDSCRSGRADWYRSYKERRNGATT